MYFHGARFSNYEAWLSDPTHIKPSAQVVWPVVGQEILNGDVGGGFQGIQITSGFFQLWRASGITSELQLYTTAIGGLILAGAMFFAGWFHYHKAAPKLEWFQNVESMLNHHLAGLLGLGSLAWAGHQIHVSLPVNKLLDAGVDPKEIPLPHELLLNRSIISDLYPSFAKGLAPFFTLNWSEYSDFLTFKGGLNPVTGGLWLSDTAHHHVAIAVLFLVAGHMYRTNWGIGHSMKEILEAHKGPFTGEGHVGLYEILTTSWHAQLAINLALFGSLSIIVAFCKWVTLNFTICWNRSTIGLIEKHIANVFFLIFRKKALAYYKIKLLYPGVLNNCLNKKKREAFFFIWPSVYGKILQVEPISRELLVKQKHINSIFLIFSGGGTTGRVYYTLCLDNLPLNLFGGWLNLLCFAKQCNIVLVIWYKPTTWQNPKGFGKPQASLFNKTYQIISLGSSETTREAFLPVYNTYNRVLKQKRAKRFFKLLCNHINYNVININTLCQNLLVFGLSCFAKQSNPTSNSDYFDFSEYTRIKPLHKSSIDPVFLTWFIGFVEGDGSFGISITENKLSFVINQADLGLMNQIRTKLGFGKVFTFIENDRTYARYSVTDKQGFLRLIAIFNGNIHLEKVHRRFSAWVAKYNEIYNSTIIVKPRLSQNLISLKNAWVAGLFDAEGCCYAGITTAATMKKKRKALMPGGQHGFRLRLKASIDQKLEYDVIEQLAKLFSVKNVTVRNAAQSYYRIEMTSKEQLTIVIQYLETFKLQSRKADAYAIWKPIVNRFNNSTHLTMDGQLLKRKTQKVQELNQRFKAEKDVYRLLKAQLESGLDVSA